MSQPAIPPQGNLPAPVPGQTILEPSPMGLGELFTTSWRALKRAPGLLLGITVAQVVAVTAIMLAGMAVVAAGFGLLGLSPAGFTDGTIGSGLNEQLTLAILAAVVAFILVFLAAALVNSKLAGMQYAAVDQLARGLRPTWDSTHRATRGVARRALTLVALYLVAVLVFFGVLAAFIAVVAAGTWQAGGSGDGRGAAAAVGIGLLCLPLLYAAVMYLAVRLLYTMAALAIEGRSGMDALRRSLELTKGRFWATLGYLIVGMLIPSFVSGILQTVLSPGLYAADEYGNPEPNMVVLGLVLLLATLVSLATAVWQVVYVAMMYIDEVRRREMARLAPAWNWSHGAPGLAGPGAGMQPGQPPLGWRQANEQPWQQPGQPPQPWQPTDAQPWQQPGQPPQPWQQPQQPWAQSGVPDAYASVDPGAVASPTEPPRNPWAAPTGGDPGTPGQATGDEPTRQLDDEPTQQLGDEPTRQLGDESTRQLPVGEPTHPDRRDPWAEPGDQR